MTDEAENLDFIRAQIQADLAAGVTQGRVHTRFPPEPNGYLHIGHAKSICLNFGIAKEFAGGKCNLRFDDTNPVKENTEFVDSIQRDIRWLGFDWQDRLYFSSDYFEQLYGFAVQLIDKGLAYVCSLSADEVRAYRGTLKEPGKDSPDRERSVADNLDLFARMRAGEFDDGAFTLRAKIDMASPNIVMRDPALYRIRRAHHHRTGDAWCIYPMYDFTHCLSDALENITHSICTLEFENNRELYDWLLDRIDVDAQRSSAQEKVSYRPHQYEMARLNISHFMMSKRRLRALVEEGTVSGWDDPRMPTISGLRRRGYTAKSIRDFCDMVGVTKNQSLIELSRLEYCVRKHLEDDAPRRSVVMKKLKITITNYPDDRVEYFDFPNHPSDESMGKRAVPFSKTLFIEETDFMEDPPKKFFRLGPGREVRLRHAYYITCNDFVKDDDGNIIEVLCTYDPESRGGTTADKRKIKGTIHWVSAAHAIDVEARLYETLFTVPQPDREDDFHAALNPQSLQVVTAKAEPSLAQGEVQDRFQFERTGYFVVDDDSTADKVVVNRVVALRDSWKKKQAR